MKTMKNMASHKNVTDQQTDKGYLKSIFPKNIKVFLI